VPGGAKVHLGKHRHPGNSRGKSEADSHLFLSTKKGDFSKSCLKMLLKILMVDDLLFQIKLPVAVGVKRFGETTPHTHTPST
jgi:hypothetical protein